MRVKWSQNFLIDKNIARKCADALEICEQDAVLEIGPGKGVLTEILLEKAGSLAAVEIDPELSGLLRAKFGGRENFSLLNRDFLDVSLETELAASGKAGDFKVIGNLPYAVTSPIIQKVLGWRGWSRAVFMVQKEVGERMMAKPGGKDYGILSVSVQSKCNVEKVCLVSGSCFRPVPNVESIVLRLEPLQDPLVAGSEEEFFFRVVKSAFAHRRKTIINSMSHSPEFSAEDIGKALKKLDISPKARAETVSLIQFKMLSEALSGFAGASGKKHA